MRRFPLLLLLLLAPVSVGAQGDAAALRVRPPADPLRVVLVGTRRAEIPITVENPAGNPQAVAVSWRLSAFLDPETRREGVETLFAPGGGQAHAVIGLDLPDRGYYELRVTVQGSAGSRSSLLLPLAAIDPPARAEMAPDSPFGINGHTPSRQALDLMKLAGIQIFRGDMNWVFFEPAAGRFETEMWDRIVADARAAKVQILPVVGYAPEWAAAPRRAGRDGSQPRDPREYASLLERLVGRYRESIRAWDLWNEPDLTWSGTPEEYGKTFALAAEAIHRADPTAAALFGGCSNGDIDTGFRAFTEGALEGLGSGRADLFSVHPYSRPRSPEAGDLRRKLQESVNYIEGHGGKRPVWVTEIGWPTADDGSSVPEPLQAAYLVRSYVLALSVPGVEKVFWYQLFSGDSPHDPEAQFGILRANLSPKPSYAAYAHMTHQLEGARFLRALDLGSIAQGYAFRPAAGGAVAVLWSVDEPVGLKAGLPRGTEVTALDGRAIRLERDEPLPLSAMPLYVRFPKGSEERRLRALESAPVVGGASVALDGGLSAGGMLAVRVTNRTRGLVTCDAGARAEGPWGPPQQERENCAVEPGGTLKLFLEAGLPESDEPAQSAALLVARVGDALASATVPLRLMTARHAVQPPKVDGDPADWEGAAGLPLADPGWLAPGGARAGWAGPADLSARLAWAWDSSGLYLCARVTDDKHLQTRDAATMWQGDSIQLAVDPTCDATSPAYDEDDSEIGLGLVQGQAVAYRWAAPKGVATGPATGICAAVRRQGTETCYEALLPWEQLGVHPTAGCLLAVCALVNDDDGAGRKWMETSPGVGESKDPRGFWRLRLSGK